MSRHEDDGNMNPGVPELLLEVEAVHAGQPDIEDQTTSAIAPIVSQEFCSRLEQFDPQVNRAEQAAQCRAYRWIIVDDVDAMCGTPRIVRGIANPTAAAGPLLHSTLIRLRKFDAGTKIEKLGQI